jgi:hypothetical protein
MRKLLALGVLALGMAASSASASVLVYEPFDYTAGQSITGQMNPSTGGTWQVAGPTALHVVGSGSLNPSAGALGAGFPASIGNDADLKKSGTSASYDRLSIPNAFNPDLTPKYGANSTLYYSLLLDVPSIAGLTIVHTNLNANNDGLIAFNNTQGTSTSAPNTWNGELVIRLGSVAGTYNLGIRGSTTTAGTSPTPTTGQTYWTGDLTPGDTHFIVVQASLGASPGDNTQDLNSIWVDPSAATYGLGELTRPAADGSSNGAESTSVASDAMESIIIGAGIATAGAAPTDTLMDEIRVGNTWADVTPVPEPVSIGLLGLPALFAMRRRKTA